MSNCDFFLEKRVFRVEIRISCKSFRLTHLTRRASLPTTPQDPALHATVFAFTDVAWRSLLDQNAARNLPSSFQNAFYLNMTQDIARFHMAVEVGDALELPTGPGSTPDNLIFIDQNKNLGMLQTAATRF